MAQAANQAAPSLSIDSFFSPEIIADPYPRYKWLRENHPVLHLPDAAVWIMSRHSDVSRLLRDKRLGHSGRDLRGDMDRPSVRNLHNSMLLANPPDHTRLRSLVVKAFNAHAVEAMRPRIRTLANDLIDKILQTDGGDLVKMFNHPFPVLVICDLLGIPREDWSDFTNSTFVNGRLVDPTTLTEEDLDAADENTRRSQSYFKGVFEKRRSHPENDLLTLLVQAENEYGKLTSEELVANVALMFAAGHETTVSLLGNAMLALYRNPDQLQLLRQKPELMPLAVEEFLRYDSSVQLTGRSALEDIDFDGHRVACGDRLVLLLGAANRDPAVFSQPDTLDVTRKEAGNLSFGGGIHFCLGAQLARIEMAEALPIIFERLPRLQLEEIDNPDWKQTITLRGLKTMPATW